jgi:hypothetical protein
LVLPPGRKILESATAGGLELPEELAALVEPVPIQKPG